MSFLISDLAAGVAAALNGRSASAYNDTLANYARKTALELQENYKFAELQTSGPIVQTITLQPNYAPSYFLATADAGLPINNIDSFFIYNAGYAPLGTNTQTNSGYNLKFRTINDIEVLINIPGIPIYWTRYEGDIWLGSCPDQAYSLYARYRHQNPFSSPAANGDMIYMPDTWQDIMELGTAMRAARDLNLKAKADELHQTLYGDNAFQISGGIEGAPGLIFQRTSQENRDQSTSMKQMRLRIGEGR